MERENWILRQIEKNAKVSAIKATLMPLLKEVNGKKTIAELARSKGITLYRNYPMIILYISGIYYLWLNKGIRSHEWIVNHIFDGIKEGYKSYIEKQFSQRPSLFREALIAKTQNIIEILYKVFMMKEKDKDIVVEILMGLFEPKKNNKYDPKAEKSAENMANLIMKGPKIMLNEKDVELHQTVPSSKNQSDDKIFEDQEDPHEEPHKQSGENSIQRFYLDFDKFIQNPYLFI